MIKNIPAILLLVLCSLSIKDVGAQSAKGIVQRAEEKIQGKQSAYTEMTITVIRPRWEREMRMKSWSKGTDLSMILVLSPAKEAGISFLKRDKEVWNWIPAIERTIKMPPSMMMQSWMGTDITNDNLVRESSVVTDYEHELLGDTVIMGRKCWKIRLIAKPEAAVVWGSVKLFIDQEDYIQLLSEFYDEDGYLIQKMRVTKIEPIDGQTLATEIEVIPVDKNGQKTVMRIDDVVFDQPMGDQFFTIQNMKKLK